jgi:hypothetical protein
LHAEEELMAPIANVNDQTPLLRWPDKKIADTGNVRLGDGFITAAFPPLSRPGERILDPGKVRLGDGFITAEFPPRT